MESRCVKCGSEKLIPDVEIEDRGQNWLGYLHVVVKQNPSALVFHQAVRSELRAQICGACGYTEFVVQQPELLYEAYLQSQRH